MGLFQGCSDGFWKNHEDLWVGYSPDDIYDEVFGVDFFGVLTLAEVLNTGGGGIVALGRQSVGALLNASSPDVNYPFTEDEVIALIQGVDPMDAMAVEELKDLFERFNTLGSPLCEED
ncbi:hypothetical protein [Rossellomorea aquimaris]|uniref:hypothetical protein n=1 Tax=Rossellomorea aquimaris TaxID=189382 RepID=UPI0005CA6988|nr:hypothetical protein [Rossellomorea aquimaris]